MRTKLPFFSSNVMTVLLYRCDTWRTTKSTLHKMWHLSVEHVRHKIERNYLKEDSGSVQDTNQWPNIFWGGSGTGSGTTIGNQDPASPSLTWNLQGKRKRGWTRNSWRKEEQLHQLGTNRTGAANNSPEQGAIAKACPCAPQEAMGHLTRNLTGSLSRRIP